MNNQEIQLHYIQTELVKKLTLSNNLRFNDLIIDGLESEHINYHIKRLIDFGLVEKLDNFYVLTNLGKDYSNLMDDKMQVVEKQPKTGILIRGIRKNEDTGKIEHLMCRRLRHPYFGKVGMLTGKVRFGETLKQACERELFEETGLCAKSYQLEEIFHKIRHTKDNEIVQDVIFYVFLVTKFSGSLIQKLEFQENFWETKDNLLTYKDKYDLYDDIEFNDSLKPRNLQFTEQASRAKGF